MHLGDMGVGRSEAVFVCQRSMGSIRRPLRIVIGRVVGVDLDGDCESVGSGVALHGPILLETQLECPHIRAAATREAGERCTDPNLRVIRHRHGFIPR